MKERTLPPEIFLPQMILFDYGHTLLSEPGYDSLRGETALMQYAVKNPRNLTPEQVRQAADALYADTYGKARALGLDLHQSQFQRLLYESLQLEFSIPPDEQERVFWDNTAPGACMPNIETALSYLRKRAIRTGVISNIGFSGGALAARIRRLLPEHSFEFILASSEYMLRKPNPMLFALAVNKAGLSPGEVWFCGDDVVCDVEGAHGADLFPVWYHRSLPNNFRDKRYEAPPACPHLYLNDWLELIDVLEGLEAAPV